MTAVSVENAFVALPSLSPGSSVSLKSVAIRKTDLVFEGQRLSHVSRETVYDDAVSVGDLHDRSC